MRALVIDDEQHAINRLRKLLQQIPDITEINSFTDANKALSYMQNKKHHIIFLDIEMPLNGLEVFKKIMDIERFIPIVFTTAYDQYAIKAFELNAIDYLLKPFKLERLKKSVNRAIEFYKLNEQKTEITNSKFKIQCFKRLTMYFNNTIINNNWRTKKADELIAYLICEQGNYVSKDKIIDNLWPGSNCKKAMSSLYTTLYYIRQQEQAQNITIPIESVRGKMRLNTEKIEIDINTLNECYKRFKSGKTINKQEIADIYTGMLFEEHDYPWSIVLQAKYENMYHDLIASQ